MISTTAHLLGQSLVLHSQAIGLSLKVMNSVLEMSLGLVLRLQSRQLLHQLSLPLVLTLDLPLNMLEDLNGLGGCSQRVFDLLTIFPPLLLFHDRPRQPLQPTTQLLTTHTCQSKQLFLPVGQLSIFLPQLPHRLHCLGLLLDKLSDLIPQTHNLPLLKATL